MAIKYLNNITLEQNELQSAVIHPLGTAPSGVEGQVYYNTGSNKLFAHNGSNWYSVNGDVESVVSGDSNKLTVSGTDTITINAVTAAVTNGSVNLVTGDHVYDFVIAQGYIDDAGVESIIAGTGISVSGATGDVTITNSDRGSSQNIFKNVAVSGQSTVVADTNNDTLTFAEGSNVTITATAATDTITISASDTNDNTLYNFNLGAVAANATTLTLDASSGDDDTVKFEGTTNEIEITTPATGDAGTVKIGLPSDVTIGNNLTVTGDLTVSGTTTTVNTETINLADNIITLNSNETGTPSQDGGIEIERGTSANVDLIWDEGTDRWTFTNDGTTYYNIPLSTEYNNYTHPTYAGDDIDVDTGALTGATVVSDIDINVSTDGLGHVTDANAAISTRTLTLADLGFTGDANANEYVHPTHAGDDINIDSGPLTGATVISDLDFNVTTDNLGHVTDANATIATRNLTASDVGAQPAGTYNTIIGTDTDYTQSGVNILKSVTMTDGVITAFTSGDMQSASTAQKGVVELATNTETAAGSSSTLAVTPAGLASVISGGTLGTANHITASVGNGADTSLTVNHNFGLTDANKVMVQLVEVSTGATVFAEVTNRATNSVDFEFTTAPSSGQYLALFTKMEY